MAKVPVAVGDLSNQQLGEVLRGFGISPTGGTNARRNRLYEAIRRDAQESNVSHQDMDSMTFDVTPAASMSEDTVRKLIQESLNERDEALVKRLSELMANQVAQISVPKAKKVAKTGVRTTRRVGRVRVNAAGPSTASEPELDDHEETDSILDAGAAGQDPPNPPGIQMTPAPAVSAVPINTVVSTSAGAAPLCYVSSGSGAVMSSSVVPSLTQVPLAGLLHGALPGSDSPAVSGNLYHSNVASYSMQSYGNGQGGFPGVGNSGNVYQPPTTPHNLAPGWVVAPGQGMVPMAPLHSAQANHMGIHGVGGMASVAPLPLTAQTPIASTHIVGGVAPPGPLPRLPQIPNTSMPGAAMVQMSAAALPSAPGFSTGMFPGVGVAPIPHSDQVCGWHASPPSNPQAPAPTSHSILPFVSEAMRRKAISGEYVRLEDFAPRFGSNVDGIGIGDSGTDSEESYLFRVDPQSGQLQANRSKKGVLRGMADWVEAFRNYQLLVIDSCEDKATVHRIFTLHAETIQRIARTSGFSQAYDFDVRRRLTAATHPIGARFHALSLPDGIREWVNTVAFSAPGYSGQRDNRNQSFSCYTCGRPGHMSRNCPSRGAAGGGSRPPFRGSQGFSGTWSSGGAGGRPGGSGTGSQVCRNFQSVSGCRNPACPRLHVCARCGRPGVSSSRCPCGNQLPPNSQPGGLPGSFPPSSQQ